MKYLFAVTCLAVFVLVSTEVSAQDIGHQSEQVFSYKIKLTKEKEPVLAAVCSIVLTGAGQAYNEQWGKGGILFGTNLVGYGLIFGSIEENDEGETEIAEDRGAMALIGLLMAVGSQIYSVVDAYNTANEINKRVSKAQVLQYESDRFSLGINPFVSRRRIGTSFSFRF